MGFMKPKRPKIEYVVQQQLPLTPAPSIDSAQVQRDLQMAEKNTGDRMRKRRGSDDTSAVAYERGPGMLGDLLKKRGTAYREAING